jgi:hypothetical protein
MAMKLKPKMMARTKNLPLSGPPNVEVILRLFHRPCYRTRPLWFFCWRGLWFLGYYLEMDTVNTVVYVVQPTGA